MSVSAAESVISPAPEPLQLLLVEDEPTQRLILARKLMRAGYLVDTAGDGREALDKLMTGAYSLLISDWEMPVMDGVELCRALRAANLPKYVYTLLLTGRNSLENVVAGLEAGADDYLVKPVQDVELRARLAAGSRIVGLEQSLRAANEENRRLSVTDPLTGAHNRRHLMELLSRELDRAVRYRRPLALVMCDLDHFKHINDAHGHQAGDDVLRGAVRLLKENVRKTDLVARYGGEEFMIVLPETPLASASIVADNLRACIAAHPIRSASLEIKVTASFGVVGCASAIPETASVDALIARCDACLYASKAAGRNRITAEALE